MIRTKNGGCVLEHRDGTTTKLNPQEFERGRAIRNLSRLGICFGVFAIDCFVLNGLGVFPYSLTVGTALVMIGWRLKTGW